jgi:hypothetical protein
MGFSARGREQGNSLPYRHRWLAGKIQPANGRWSWGQRPRSKPRRWGLLWGLGGDGRLTKEAGGGDVLGRQVRVGERPEEQPRVPARGSSEFTASVRSSGQCRGVWRGTGAAVRGGSTMASMTAQWRRRGRRRKKGHSTGGAPFIAGGGGWQRRRELQAERWRRCCSDWAADGWAPVASDFFSIYPKPAQL